MAAGSFLESLNRADSRWPPRSPEVSIPGLTTLPPQADVLSVPVLVLGKEAPGGKSSVRVTGVERSSPRSRLFPRMSTARHLRLGAQQLKRLEPKRNDPEQDRCLDKTGAQFENAVAA
jgi:hypothetical protein